MENREVVLKKLYALRAGLSYISACKDLREACIAHAKTTKVLLGVANSDYNSYNYSVKASVHDIPKLEAEIRELEAATGDAGAQIDKLEGNVRALERAFASPDSYPNYVNRMKRQIAEFPDDYKESDIMPLGDYIKSEFAVSGAYIIIGDLAYYMVEQKKYRRHRKHITKFIQKLKDQAVKCRKKDLKFLVGVLREEESKINAAHADKLYTLREKRETLKKANEIFPALKKKRDDLAAELAESEGRAKYSVDAAIETYDYLLKKYSPMLSPSHWDKLDTIIYYVQENYADTVKEALNLDLQRREHESLMNKIDDATNTITSSISRMQNSVMSEISDLSGRIDQLDYRQSALSSQIAGLNENISINNALRSKANETSAQLADDLRYLRNLASR